MARELDQSGWTMYHVLVMRQDCMTAVTMGLVYTIVAIMKMLVSDVSVSNLHTIFVHIFSLYTLNTRNMNN